MPDIADSHLMDYWKNEERQHLEQLARQEMPENWGWKGGIGGAVTGGITGGITGLGVAGLPGAAVGGVTGAAVGGVLGALTGRMAARGHTRNIEEARGALMQPESELDKYLRDRATAAYIEHQQDLAERSAPVTNVTTNVHDAGMRGGLGVY
jgi:hypothetical protein